MAGCVSFDRSGRCDGCNAAGRADWGRGGFESGTSRVYCGKSVRRKQAGGHVSEKHSRLEAFEARLSQLKKNMEAGLGERAARIRSHALSLPHDAAAAREGLRHESHKLRGVAGTFGHAALGELAGSLEAVAPLAQPSQVAALAMQLVAAVQRAGIAVPDQVASEAPPVQEATPQPAEATTPTTTPTTMPTATRRVLAIDDDAETRRLLELVLRHMGACQTVVAADGNEGLASLARDSFDLVLCDAMMPDMNGLTFCERALALNLPNTPPIVILSAADPHELGWNVNVQHAPAAWWRKPFRPKDLLAAIDKLLGTPE